MLSAWGGKELFSWEREEWISLQEHLRYPFLGEMGNSPAPSEPSRCLQPAGGKAGGALGVSVGC